MYGYPRNGNIVKLRPYYNDSTQIDNRSYTNYSIVTGEFISVVYISKIQSLYNRHGWIYPLATMIVQLDYASVTVEIVSEVNTMDRNTIGMNEVNTMDTNRTEIVELRVIDGIVTVPMISLLGVEDTIVTIHGKR